MNITPIRKRERSLAPRTMQSDFEELVQRFFGDSDWPASRLPEVFQGKRMPACDVAETAKEFTVTAELPGLEEKDIELELRGNYLLISGERKWKEEQKDKEYHRVETQYGVFQRSIPLPENLRLDPDAITASYQKGMLTVKIPKVEPTPPRKIQVKAKE